jgi:hypothetical protein
MPEVINQLGSPIVVPNTCAVPMVHLVLISNTMEFLHPLEFVTLCT